MANLIPKRIKLILLISILVTLSAISVDATRKAVIQMDAGQTASPFVIQTSTGVAEFNFTTAELNMSSNNLVGWTNLQQIGDMAEAGAIRLTNNQQFCSEASPAGSDLCITIGDASENWIFNTIWNKIDFGANELTNAGISTWLTNQTFKNPQINGLDINYTKFTADHTAEYTEDNIVMDVTSASRSLTLPTAVGHTGKIFTIKMIGLSAGNIVMIKTTSSQTIDNFVGTTSTINMTHVDEIVTVQSNGANWDTVFGFDPSEPQDYFIRGSTTRWYGKAIDQTASSILVSVGSTLRASPWIVPHTIEINRIQFEISTASNPTTTTCRVGIYTNNGNIYPLKLLSATEFLSADTTAGVKTSSIFGSPLTITKGLYWMAWTCGTSATTQPTFRADPVGAIAPVLGVISTMGANPAGTAYTVAFTYGALPATYPAGATILANTPSPMILVEIDKG